MLLLLFSLTILLSSSQANSNDEYTDLALKKCNEEWSIHGLWPEYGNSSWPQFCNKTKYADLTHSSIKPILLDLEKYWYSGCYDYLFYAVMDVLYDMEPLFIYSDQANWKFWTHEWQKHGTCTNYTVLEYFSTGIKLFKDFRQQGLIQKCCSSNKAQCLIHVNGTC